MQVYFHRNLRTVVPSLFNGEHSDDDIRTVNAHSITVRLCLLEDNIILHRTALRHVSPHSVLYYTISLPRV